MAALTTGELKSQITNPSLFEAAKRRRDANYNQVLVPALRLAGMFFIVLAVFFHLKYIDGVDPGPKVTSLGLLYAVYGLASWAFLKVFYRPFTRPHWGDLFLVLDPVLWMVAIYLTGAERSELFFILLARVADQTNSTFSRCLNFLNISALAYVLMLVLLLAQGKDVDWASQWSRLTFLYLCGLYISLTALAAQRLRARNRQAVRLAKDTIDQLASQNAELDRARSDAEEVSRLKSDFLATMSHELRTPLNSVIGFCQLLEEPSSGELNDRQQRYLGNSLNAAHRLHALIGDILDLSKIEAGGLEVDLGPVDLRILLRQSAEALSVEAAARNLTITESFPGDFPMAWADGFRLRQVSDNLLSNAVKYNVEGGRIEVSTRQEPDGTLVMAVQDTGPGIAPEDQDRIFQAFVQLDTGYQRRQEGTGLGLALCKALCKLQQAELELISPVGEHGGARFEVHLRPYRKRGG
jgi:signal transduction histidine kinase